MNTKRKEKKLMLLVILMLAVAMIVAACGGNTGNTGGAAGENINQENQGGSQDTNEEEPTEISIMSHFFSPTPPSDDNAVEQKIEEITNTKLDIQWVSANNYTDKLNVSLASGDMPDLLFINDPFSPTYRTAAEQGAFWDISQFIDDYPNLSATISPIAWELTTINGAQYGIPRPRPSESDTFFMLRKDWLDNVGLEVPETSDELYEVMKAFTEGDPNQSGAKDTIGFAGYVNPSDMGNMGNFENIFTGANGNWKDVDGELVFTALLPELREALEFLARAYEEKLIPEDFASLKPSQVKDMFRAGKAGMLNQKAGAMQEAFDSLIEIDPDFDFMNLYPLTNINGFNPKGPGFAGVNVIAKSVPEDKVRKILAMYDKWTTDEVFLMHKHGLEDVHHTVENGEIVVDTDKMVADAVADHNQIVYVSDPYASSTKTTFPDEVIEFYEQVQDERAKTSVADVSIGLYSETAQTYQPELLKNLQDMKTKVILGRESLEAWDTFVADLQANQNFIKMSEELNEAYQNR
jgi:putative aldouronate transport system substrate-binding protein